MLSGVGWEPYGYPSTLKAVASAMSGLGRGLQWAIMLVPDGLQCLDGRGEAEALG